MARTQLRPLPTGKISVKQAIFFALILSISGFIILWLGTNSLTAWLTLLTLIGYAVIYTGLLKRTTSQNIVLGGLSGAMPPLLGWTAVTGQISTNAWLLVMIIFVWTPPHFWPLAIYRYTEYSKVKTIPMLPITRGIVFTKLNILIYTFLLIPVSFLPFMVGMSGITYLISAILLGLGFLYHAIYLKISDKPIIAHRTFQYSIWYLLLLFIVLLVDHSVYNRLGV